MIPPRATPDRDSYYMALAIMNAARSKDPNTQVGAVIVSKDNKPISTGYNGPPSNIDDDQIDWSRPNKYKFILHAEDNAIKHARGVDLRGATLYVTGFPCRHCALDIVAVGVDRVVYLPLECDALSLVGGDEQQAALDVFDAAGTVLIEEFNSNRLSSISSWLETYLSNKVQ